MSLPIRSLPIAERWDCHMCGICCRGSIVRLDAQDLARLQEQRWEEDAALAGKTLVVREGWRGQQYRLAQQEDGACVFLTPQGACRIHQKYGLEAKPLMCQMFPLQVVPLEKHAQLTIRRSCPSAAADRGRVVEQQRGAAAELAARRGLLEAPPAPPLLVRGRAALWPEAMLVMNALERLMLDERYPLIRRLAHSLDFTRLLQQCRLRRLDRGQLRELVQTLEKAAPEQSAAAFANREAPSRGAGVIFRQAAIEYLRLHPGLVTTGGWSARWRLMRAALRVARGKGPTPEIHPLFPATSFDELEKPLGHLPEEVLRPFNRFFETMALSKQYAIVTSVRGTLLDRFQALALCYPVGLWLLRWKTTGRTPLSDDSLMIVTALDRGQGYETLTGRRHRERVRTLAAMDALTRLAVWYAR